MSKKFQFNSAFVWSSMQARGGNGNSKVVKQFIVPWHSLCGSL